MTEQERLHEEDLQRIRGFRLMDDDFMNVCLENNPEDTELILRIILGDGSLKVIDSKTQYLIKSLKGRDVWLDVKAEDANGRQMNIEIQRDDFLLCIVFFELNSNNPLYRLLKGALNAVLSNISIKLLCKLLSDG